MENKKTYWKDVINMLKQDAEIKNIEIDYRNEKIEFKDVALLNRNGFRVPENLVYYDDDNIDFSDDPDITGKDIANGKIKWIHKVEIPIPKEIEDWIKEENVDINTLLSDLVENFYKTMKNIRK
jgi:hypothetical protein